LSYICETCGKEYKTRSGLWKHQKKFNHGKFSEAEVIESKPTEKEVSFPPPQDEVPPTDSSLPPPSEAVGEDTHSNDEWFSFDFGDSEDKTDVIPTTLKMVVNQPDFSSSKMSKAQREALKTQNTAILKMGLTTVDTLLSKYGQAVSLDKDFKVEHSESDKDLVANAQYRYLEEKGLFLTNYLSSGIIAGSLTAWYIGSPILRIRKKKKRNLIVGGFLSRLPLIGRLFKRKHKPVIAQNVDSGVEEYVNVE
tara:strand:- start:418 stop:1170 length:753 start_codon:yes stop_codon:yes gene_type:complete